MSVSCRVASPPLLLRTLYAIAINKDSWATVVFTSVAVVLHVEGSDLTMTATATLPRSLFTEYDVTEARLMVSVANLIEALLLLGPGVLMSSSTTVTLLYDASDAKLRVRLSSNDHDAATASTRPRVIGLRTVQSTLLTRPARRNVLDLHFADAETLAQATLRGDALREILGDLMQMQSQWTGLSIDPARGVYLHGEGSPYGEVDVMIKRHCDALYSIGAGEQGGADGDAGLAAKDTAERGAAIARTRLSTLHLAIACAGKAMTNLFVRGRNPAAGGPLTVGGILGDPFLGLAGGSGNALVGGAGAMPGVASSLFGGVEQVSLQVNASRQLSVTHVWQEQDIRVSVTVVVMPLHEVEL